MNNELEILKLADYYEKFEYKNASAYLIINNKIENHKCMFGFTEFPNDIEVARELFNRLEMRAREKGFNELVGPLNYCSWMSYRWAINNYDLKLFPDCNNPKYYVDIIKKLGYKELYTYRSAFIDINNPLFFIGEETYKEKLKEGYTFKFFEGKEVYKLAKEVYDISINAFEGSFLYSDIPFEYFENIYLSWTKNLNIGMFIAYYNGNAIGYVMGYDNPYSKTFISKTSAVKKEYQKHRVYVALLYLGCKYVLDKGYKDMIYHFQCEQKDIFKRFNSDIESKEKRYAVFIKEFNSNEKM